MYPEKMKLAGKKKKQDAEKVQLKERWWNCYLIRYQRLQETIGVLHS